MRSCKRSLVLLAVACSTPRCWAYYLPGTYPQEFYEGQTVRVETNSLVSNETELPYNYYSMPFCKPPEGVRKAVNSVNPGTILTGTRIENSPYNFSMLIEERTKLTCSPDDHYKALEESEAQEFRDKIDQDYWVRLILDNLPITTYDLEKNPDSIRPGFQVGSKADDKYYVNNHLMFKVLVHKTNGQYTKARESIAEIEAAAVIEGGARRRLRGHRALLEEGGEEEEETARLRAAAEKRAGDGDVSMYMVVGFEVLACSIQRTPGQPLKDVSCLMQQKEVGAYPQQEVTTGAEIVYTYDVYWDMSDITWASRWDAYLRMPGGRVHWFSILNSLMVVLVMSSIVAMIMMRTIRRDLARYEGLLGETGGKEDPEESGWKMVSGDVFRAPSDPTLLCVQLGSGVQITTSATITLLFAALGFLSPASRGALLTALLVMYLLLAVAAGYAAVWLWGLITHSYDNWSGITWRCAAYYPGIILATLSFLNVLLAWSGSSGAIPLAAFFSLISLWFIVSIPLCFAGGLLATKQEIKQYPTRTNQIPRHIPPSQPLTQPLVLLLAAGLLPFGTIFVELYFAMTSVWQGYFYYIFGFCLVVGLLTVLITVEVAVVTTYVQLCAEDYLWWWRSFHRGGAVALYIGLYSIGFLFNTLHLLSGIVSVILYLAYMALVVLGIYLAMGTIGFLASLYFTYQIFSAVKAD